jgi:hypothetical protein
VSIAALLIVFDVRNRDRFRLNCRESRDENTHTVHVELQQGRRLLWPFGYETVGGAFKPLALAADADCRVQVFKSRGEKPDPAARDGAAGPGDHARGTSPHTPARR